MKKNPYELLIHYILPQEFEDYFEVVGVTIKYMSHIKSILLFLCLACQLSVLAQEKVFFSYDEAGNRIRRAVVVENVVEKETQAMAKTHAKDNDSFDVALNKNISVSAISPSILNIHISDFPVENDSEAYMEICNTAGAKISRQKITGTDSSVDIGKLQQGIYILRVTINGIPTSYKVTKR